MIYDVSDHQEMQDFHRERKFLGPVYQSRTKKKCQLFREQLNSGAVSLKNDIDANAANALTLILTWYR